MLIGCVSSPNKDNHEQESGGFKQSAQEEHCLFCCPGHLPGTTSNTFTAGQHRLESNVDAAVAVDEKYAKVVNEEK